MSDQQLPDKVRASLDDCPDVTTWVRHYDDCYMCECCGSHERFADLRVVADD